MFGVGLGSVFAPKSRPSVCWICASEIDAASGGSVSVVVPFVAEWTTAVMEKDGDERAARRG